MARDDPRRGAAPGVLHSITGLNVGGAEMMLARLLPGFDPETEPQRVLSLLRPGRLANSITGTGAKLTTLGMTRSLPGPAALLKLARVPRSPSPELVQGWMYHGNLAATALRLRGLGRAGLVWSVHHSLTDIALEKPLTRRLIGVSARASRYADAIIYVSSVSARQHEAIGFDPRRTVVIPNGVDTNAFAPDPAAGMRLRRSLGVAEGRLLVGNVARLHPMKDHAGLIRAVAWAISQGADIHLVLAGEHVGPEDAAIGRALAETGLRDRVSFLGLRDDIPDIIPGFDIFVSPSAYGESFPVVVAEAMAAGVPCIATDLGDTAELVGPAGRIVPPNDPHAMGAALAAISCLTCEERHAIGRAARARIEASFTIAAIIDRYRALYIATAERRAA